MKKEENITYDLKVKEEEILTLVILLSQLIEDYQYNQEHKKKRNKIELKYYVKDNNFLNLLNIRDRLRILFQTDVNRAYIEKDLKPKNSKYYFI
jgi:hypothetical protein